MAGPDPADPYSRDRPLGDLRALPARLRLGVPRDGQLYVLRRQDSEAAYGDALEALDALGAELVEIDFEPFYETARLLYEGPWVAERYLVPRLLASSPDAMHPVTREIIVAAARLTRGRYLRGILRLQELAQASPSAPSPDRRAACCRPRRRSTRPRRCWPIRSSSTAGSAPTPISSTCSISAGWRCRRRFAATACRSASRCWRPAGQRCAACEHRPRLPCRHQTDARRQGPDRSRRSRRCAQRAASEIAIAVVGAHLSGMPLNGELTALGGRLLEAAVTAPDYQLYALATTPPKPGLLRVERRQGRGDRARSLGAVGGGVRPVRRRGPAAAVDRHRQARRRPRRQRFSGRGCRRRRRARHLRVRRLARVYERRCSGRRSNA